MREREIAKSFTKKFILKRKYKLLAEDFATNKALIEFVFKDLVRNEIVFIPIRIVDANGYLKQQDIFNYLQNRSIDKTIKWYLMKHNCTNQKIRVDLAEVLLGQKKAKLKYSMKTIY